MTKSLLYNESLRPRIFPDSGAKVTQLTSSALIHTNIYPEAPVFTPDARYFIYNRFESLDGPNSFWLCDVKTQQLQRLTEEPSVTSPVMAPTGDWMAYLDVRTPTEWAVKRFHLATREYETVALVNHLRRPYPLATISPDG